MKSDLAAQMVSKNDKMQFLASSTDYKLHFVNYQRKAYFLLSKSIVFFMYY